MQRSKLRWGNNLTLVMVKSPGQTDSQVVASWKLGSTCDSVWPGLACSCVDLRWLAMTCDHFGRDKICRFFTVWLPNSSLFASSTCRYSQLLANPFDQGLTLVNQVQVETAPVHSLWYLSGEEQKHGFFGFMLFETFWRCSLSFNWIEVPTIVKSRLRY